MAKPTLDEIFGNRSSQRPSLDDIFGEQNKIDQPLKWTPEMQAKYEAMNIPQGSVVGGFGLGALKGMGHGLERLLNGVTLGGYGWANNKLGWGYDKRKKELDDAGLAGQIAGGATELVGGVLPFVASAGSSSAVQGPSALAKTAAVANQGNAFAKTVNVLKNTGKAAYNTGKAIGKGTVTVANKLYANPVNNFLQSSSGLGLNARYGGKYIIPAVERIGRNGLVGAGMAGLNSGFNNGFDVDTMIDDAKTGGYVGMAFPAAGYTLKGVGNLTSGLLGMTTGTGSAVKQAFDAGRRRSPVFINQMRGNADKFEPVNLVKDELQKRQRELSKTYREGINSVFKNEQNINPKPIYEAFDNIVNDLNYNGFSKVGSTTQKTVGQINKILKEFAANEKLHTPEGLDALKRRIGDISIPQGELSAKRVKDIMYNNVSEMITEQAPGYANVMKGYAQGKEVVRQMESALGVGGNKAPETSLKKIQSVFKNDRGSSWGARTDLATSLNGNNKLFDSVAGQALSSPIPRGLKASLGGVGTAASSFISPSFLMTLPAFSPRVVGEAAYGVGRGVSKLDPSTLSKLYYGTLPKTVENMEKK